MLTEEFDGPYTEEELNTWIAQANLPASALLDLDNLTGGAPRLLRFYGECGGDRQQWLKRIKAKYEDKLWTEFVGKLDSKEDLVSAINMISGSVTVLSNPGRDPVNRSSSSWYRCSIITPLSSRLLFIIPVEKRVTGTREERKTEARTSKCEGLEQSIDLLNASWECRYETLAESPSTLSSAISVGIHEPRRRKILEVVRCEQLEIDATHQ
ncbi:hypothetical protein SELMODRAFT_420770 [Selaginella moellendorffii]|uniref:Uncharacterized protein n=1 Tax=Selaginella moellendorffii TaxID=88036 RepID=D8SD22_SELML|nr:hypothetical protein SELMODRAFT_420770 [Selaginella moellendorffii]